MMGLVKNDPISLVGQGELLLRVDRRNIQLGLQNDSAPTGASAQQTFNIEDPTKAQAEGTDKLSRPIVDCVQLECGLNPGSPQYQPAKHQEISQYPRTNTEPKDRQNVSCLDRGCHEYSIPIVS
jgi:hypothetical protein